MSEYTEAISSIYFTMHNRVKPKTLGHCEDKNLEVLEELAERATPKKPIKKKFNEAKPWDCADYFVERNACPACERKMTNKSNYCPNCGQALDWGK